MMIYSYLNTDDLRSGKKDILVATGKLILPFAV